LTKQLGCFETQPETSSIVALPNIGNPDSGNLRAESYGHLRAISLKGAIG